MLSRKLQNHLHTFLLTASLAFAQNAFAKTNHENGFWLGTFAQKKLTYKYSLWAENQVRYSFDLGGTEQTLYRAGLLQKLNRKHGLGYLYGYVQSSSLKEHRLTLQHTQKYGRISGHKLSHRVRLEIRLFEDSIEDIYRLRYLVRTQKNIIGSKWKFVGWNEVFLNLNQRNSNDEFFDRNRLFLGTRKPFFESNLELGYLNQYVPRSGTSVMQHLAVLYVFF